VLAEGRLVAAGDPRDVLTADLVREVYGVDCAVLTHPRTGRPVIAFGDPVPGAASPADADPRTPRPEPVPEGAR